MQNLSAPHPTRSSLLRRGLRLLARLAAVAALTAAVAGMALWGTLPDVASLADPQTTVTIEVRDWQGDTHPFLLGPANPDWVPLRELPEELPWAVIVAEDANFYAHRGFDLEAIREALVYDLQQKRLARGASTITQQLAKNLFLSREKSFSRKLREVLIAWKLERHLEKERILELYLNLVELGPLVHGVEAGARHHFGKPASRLSAAEAAFLAAILPGPRVAFNPEKHPQRVRERAASLLHFMQLRRKLSEEEFALAREAVDCLRSLPLQELAASPGEDVRCTTDSNGGEPPDRDELSIHDANTSPPPWQLPFSGAS